MQMRRGLKRVLLSLCAVILLVALCLGTINAIVILKSKPYILKESEAADLEDVDCILVLGCAVWNGQTLSPMLEDRVKTGLSLFENGVSDRLLMSGDHGKENYDEVNHMKAYCVDKGIDPDVIFLDHAGFSTYESMYRAKEIFGVKKMIVVTQGYHLYRAVYIARVLGVDAYGVAADLQDYALVTDIKNNLRESLARVKDFGTCLVKPEPTYLGEAIPIDGSAKLSDDKEYV
ncbi:MAG: ElyC/SanA/YdcF family protein [Clostridia bacterium]|nr:ElyC/SanA/YdcF family protein [Clostridia bacterium]